MRGGLLVLRDVLRNTVLVLAGLAAVVLVIGGLIVWEYTRGGHSPDTIQDAIEDDIPVGSSLSDIEAWLAGEGEERGIEKSPRETYKAERFSRLRELGVPADTLVLPAILRGNPGLNIYFLLDSEMRFERVIVERYSVLP